MEFFGVECRNCQKFGMYSGNFIYLLSRCKQIHWLSIGNHQNMRTDLYRRKSLSMIDRLKLNINLISLRYRLLHFLSLSLSISRKACVIIIDVVVVVVAFTTLVQCLLNDSKYWISFKIQVLTVDSVMLLKNYACRLNISVRWDRGDWEWERNA